MSQFFAIHPENPQPRLIAQAARLIDGGGVAVYPTDSCYAIGCGLGEKEAMERIARIRDIGRDHNFTLVCRDLSDIGTYARIDKAEYRLLKTLTPGPYTFILRATGEVPRRLQHPKRRTIGIRVPDHAIVQALLERLERPLMSATLQLPGDEFPLTDASLIRERLEHQVDLVIDGGNCGLEPTTVLRLDEGRVEVERRGRGPVDFLERA
ncbi:MAG: L-threonylcarbamoyladenylate synthase [Halofilum sp. (in: g-proteobacteria)]|nr:L-threonylcarbamoyladenylate synthase [Halofilum sp. (in: g-proteobacteria)]